MIDLLLPLLRCGELSCLFHPNTFSDRRRGEVVIVVVPGDDCNDCRLLLDIWCCCNCRDDDGFCQPNTFSLWSKLFLALTPPNNSKRGRNRALRVIMFICSPRRRRDGRTINACLCSSESLLLLARVVLVLAALMLPCSLIILLPQVCHFLSHFFYPKFWISLQPQRQRQSLRLMTSI